MQSVGEVDLSGLWYLRNGALCEVKQSQGNRRFKYVGTLQNGAQFYLDKEGCGAENHTEYDLIERVRDALVQAVRGG